MSTSKFNPLTIRDLTKGQKFLLASGLDFPDVLTFLEFNEEHHTYDCILPNGRKIIFDKNQASTYLIKLL